MADDKPKHQHHKNDIIIKDQDGSFKILQEGKFVPLDDVEAKAHGLDVKTDKKPNTKPQMPKELEVKPVPQFQGRTRNQEQAKASHEIKGLADQDLQKQAQALLKKSGVTFASGEAQQRVIKVLVSHLKGVRKPFETKQNLMKSPMDGGVGLEADQADKILEAAGVKAEMPKEEKSQMPKELEVKPVPQFQGRTRNQEQEKASHEIKGLADQDLQKQAQALLKKSGVTFASGEAQQRVIKVLVSHLKGVRKPFETKQNLMKSPMDGGVGLEADQADKILEAAGVKAEMPKEEKPQMPKAKPEPKKASAMPMGHDVSTPAKMAKELPMKEAKPKAPLPPVQTQKPQIMDVQKPKMPTVGLAGELSYSLADWRRVSVNPQDRIKKIENQLGVLEEENFPMRLRGLKAWRNSEVMKLYLQAGKDSLEKGQPLEQLLGQGSASQLTWEEWKAIAELNQRIRA